MATFGTTTIGGTTVALETEKDTLSRVAKPIAGTISKLTVYIADGTVAGTVKLKALVYADAAEEKPGALLAEGTEVTYTHGEGNKWVDLPITVPPDVAATHVHIGWKLGGPANVAKFAYDATGAEHDHRYFSQLYATPAPAEWTTTGFDNHTFSVYGTFTRDPATVTNPGTQANTVGIPINPVPLAGSNVESWTATGLPAGLALDGATGIISGTPSSVGSSTVTVTAHGEANTVEETFTWTVQAVASVGTFAGYTAFSPNPGPVGAPTSAFNIPVGAHPTALANSAEMVNWLLTIDGPGMGKTHTRNQFPTVYARNSDPQVRIIDAAKGFFHEKSIRIPAVAKPQSNSDKHLQVVLCPSDCALFGVPEGTTCDFWQAGGEADPSEVLNIVEGTLHVSSSGKGNITGSQVFTGKSVAANYDLNAGVIRGPEIMAGVIPHALVAVVHEVAKAPAAVYPANHSDGNSTDPRAPAMGQRFYLAMSDAEINAAGLPHPFQVAIAKALAGWGFYLEDTAGASQGVAFRTENDNMYLAFGAAGYFARVAASQGLPVDSEGNVFDYSPLLSLCEAHLVAIGPPVLPAATLNHCDVFPPGTTVGAWPITNRQGDQRPVGQPIASVAADGAGGLALELAPGEYVLWGEVGARGRAIVLALGG